LVIALGRKGIGRIKELKMPNKRKIEVFSAGCATCREAVESVKRAACSSCEVIVLDMKDIKVAERAKTLGIRSVPAVVIDGKLADCCAGRGIDERVLRAAGLGQPL
jgi:glutaredoxin 3